MTPLIVTPLCRATFFLAHREFMRFIRQPHRVAASLGQPLLFWVFLGTGFSASFHPPGLGHVSYLEYFYPGVLMMLILFASIFSVITVIEDRERGFLQGVLTAPIPRFSIALGKILGGASIAFFQSSLLLVLLPFLDLTPTVGGFVLVGMGMILSAIGYTALSFAIAWPMTSTSGFHAIMMIFLMPLWLLSGALFPMNGSPAWLQGIMVLNPVSHALTLIRVPFYHSATTTFYMTDYITSLSVVLGWVGLCLWWSASRVSCQGKSQKILKVPQGIGSST